MYQLNQLKNLRWAVRFTLLLGVAASVAANILHALPNFISQTISAWPPLALLLTVELVSRIPITSRTMATVRILATATIAGIAAWVSYWHMVGTVANYGESSAHLLPFTVDGLIVVASVSLVALAGKIREIEMDVEEPVAYEATAPVSPGMPSVSAPTAAAVTAQVYPTVPTAKPASQPSPAPDDEQMAKWRAAGFKAAETRKRNAAAKAQ